MHLFPGVFVCQVVLDGCLVVATQTFLWCLQQLRFLFAATCKMIFVHCSWADRLFWINLPQLWTVLIPFVTPFVVESQVTGQDLCNNPDFVCNTAENGFVTAIGYWMKNCQEWDASHTFDAALAAIRPANTQANPERRASFYEWLKALGISPVTTTPKPPMPDEGETQVKAGEGCWQIADRCCDGQAGLDKEHRSSHNSLQ